jgi:hypothetical protein
MSEMISSYLVKKVVLSATCPPHKPSHNCSKKTQIRALIEREKLQGTPPLVHQVHLGE